MSHSRPLHGEVGGEGCPLRLGLLGDLALRLQAVEGGAQVDAGADGVGAPHRVLRRCRDRLALDGEEEGRGEPGQHPSGVPEPHGVGHEDEHGPGERRAARSLHMPVGEGRPVGGVAPPDDADGAPVREGDGGVQERGPVPAKPYGVCDGGEGCGQPVYGGQGVEALHQVAPPLGGHGMGAHQLVRGHVLLIGEPPQPCGGEVEPLGRGEYAGCVGHGVAEAARVQLPDDLVDRALRPAGDGDDLRPVEEGHRRQGAEGLGLASCGPHSFASSFAPSPLSSPSFSNSAARSLKSRTFFRAGASAKEMSWADRV